MRALPAGPWRPRGRAALALALALAPALAARGQEAVGDDDPWAPLLAAAGLDPAAAQLDPGRWRGGGRLALDPLFERLWGDWRAAAPWAEGLGRALVAAAAAGDLAAVASLAAGPLAGGAAAGEDGPPPALAPDGRAALADALRALHAALGLPLADADAPALAAFVRAAPPEVAAVAAAVLVEVPGVLEAQARALAPWGAWPGAAGRVEALALGRYRGVDDAAIGRLEAQDGAALGLAALRLARGLARARAAALARPAPRARFAARWETPLGAVELRGADDDVHDGRPRLLLVDAGGDDVHPTGGATSPATPVSVVVDLAGDDTWGDPRADGVVAAGVAGCAAVLDLRGDDRYRARAHGLGCGLLGVGLLVDAAGDDRYVGRRHAAGAATAGLGLLVDLGGDDVHEGLERIQGFAQARGVGLLLDVAGADRYVADDATITNPSPQTAAHNTSLAQGCGFGRRAHPGDGRSLAGGLGLLVDGRGDDVYRAGVFGQGVGYWYGVGALVDLAGDDDGQAAWYGRGAAAHFAVGVLVDAAGDDRHAVTLGQGLGQGQDLSVGVLVDRRGDDRYASPVHALGAALWNGVGVLLDEAGDDAYACGGFATLGDPGLHQRREGGRALGLFLDRGGRDRLPAGHPHARAGTTWVVPAEGRPPGAAGVGRAAGEASPAGASGPGAASPGDLGR